MHINCIKSALILVVASTISIGAAATAASRVPDRGPDPTVSPAPDRGPDPTMSAGAALGTQMKSKVYTIQAADGIARAAEAKFNKNGININKLTQPAHPEPQAAPGFGPPPGHGPGPGL